VNVSFHSRVSRIAAKAIPYGTICVALVVALTVFPSSGFSQQASSPLPTGTRSLSFGGMGWAWFSQFANPALVGALYMTPDWPKTGYYPVYPGAFSRPITEDGIAVGPARLHPILGVAEIYTDNVFRTNSNRRSDFATTLAPGIQAELPFAGRHTFSGRLSQQHSSVPSESLEQCAGSNRVWTIQFRFSRRFATGCAGRAQVGT
jgi:hypothetical protein